MVGRDVVAGRAVEVGLADLERILAQRIGDVLDPALAGDDSLRTAEAAESGIGLRVGIERLGAHPYRWIPVRIVGVEQGAVGDGTREIGRVAGAGGVGRLHGLYPA